MLNIPKKIYLIIKFLKLQKKKKKKKKNFFKKKKKKKKNSNLK